MQRISILRLTILLCCTLLTAACLTNPLEDDRTQRYASTSTVLQISPDRIEENLGVYHAACGNARWMRRPKKGSDTREMVWGRRVNARTYRVDGWIEFEPLGGTRTQVTLNFTPAVRNEVMKYLQIIQDPLTCR